MTPELRELLELSAKAMGYLVLPRGPDDGEWLYVQKISDQTCGIWLPHGSRAQCFDMECALGITVDWSRQDDRVVAFIVKLREKPARTIGRFSDHNNDRTKARMMAVLRVAAEIGRRMQG